MQKPSDGSVPAHVPLAVRWRRMRAAYRYANLATHHVLGFAVKLTLALYFGFALLLLVLRYAILPNIDLYKSSIEQIASRALGNQVSIARIYASWSGLRPSLFLGDVVLRDRAGRQVLSLPSVVATLSWWSLAKAEPSFESLEIIRPELDVRREPDGTLYVAGIRVDTRQGTGGGADWALAQREIVIREGRVNWTDRGKPALALEQVNLVLRNRWRRHRFGLQATPPASLGLPVDVRADFQHPPFAARISDVALWTGELYADIRGADLAAWKTYVSYPFELSRGQGALRAWLTLDRARLAGFTADVGLNDVALRLAPDLPLLDLVRVQGRVSAREDLAPGASDGRPTFGTRGHALSLNEFSLQTRDGLTLPPTSLSERYVAGAAGQPGQTEVKARVLDLQTVAALAARLPLTAPQRALLQQMAPRGRLLDVSAEWQGAWSALRSYRVRGRLAGVGLTPQPARAAQPKTAGADAQPARPPLPGFDNLTGSIDATERGGTLNLDSSRLVLQMPAWFSEPAMPFDKLSLQAHWSFEERDRLRLRIDALNFVQKGLGGTLSGSHVIALHGAGPGTADFSATLNNFDVKSIGRYLPLNTPPDLRAWLTGALQDGMAQDVSLRLRGDLARFPFKGDSGSQFRVAGRIVNGKLNYTPGLYAANGKAPLWPPAENIQGSFLFERARMEIRGDRASTGGVALAHVKAVVADLGSSDMLLDIDGTASGPLQKYLKYVADSPVLEWISRFTDQTSGSGNANLALKLHLPLARLPESKVQGTLQLMNNQVHLFDDLPPVQDATGQIEFYEKGVNLNSLAGTFLGGPVAVSGGTQRDNSILVRIAGSVSADGLRKNYPAPVMQRLAARLSGSTRYTGLVTAVGQHVQLTVDSSLAGLGLDFPAPARKAGPDSMALKFVMNAAPPNEAGLLKDELRISLGAALAASYQRQRKDGEPWRVTRGGIGVNVAAPEPDAGVMLNVSLKSLDVDAWSRLGSAIAGPAHPDGGAGADGPDIAQYVLPDVIAARASELIFGERKLEHVVLGASRQNGGWQANIDSTQASGYLMWNDAQSGAGAGKISARLAALIIPESAAADVKDLLEGKSTAQTIPALDIVAERFELFGKQLGRLELQADNAVAAAGREWRIGQLSLANPDGQLKGSGKWSARDGQSSLNFVLDIADAGKLLDRFGFADTLRGGKGKLSGDIGWKGLPYSLDIPSLSGQIAMNVESGQFLKQDPGAAKLLGVLSLQALPRLLKLDFHDVFSEGLAFDGISASASITRGVVKTDNLKMHGVAATVLMDGTADIANESSNLHVVVIPEFNLGTGPLVYALAVNPVIGIGSFLAQLFLRAPVMKAMTYQMQITGPWKAPLVTKLEHTTGTIP